MVFSTPQVEMATREKSVQMANEARGDSTRDKL
jgi:hypothetical protein